MTTLTPCIRCWFLQELGGVMHRFDKDGDGTVDVVEFTKTFFKMGFDERAKRAKEKREAEAVRSRARRGAGVFTSGSCMS